MRENKKVQENFLRLVQTMDRLRAPDGCPWDKVQTEATVKNHLLEEAYEVLAAVEANNPQNVCEELGDLLFLIIFLTLIYEERGLFNINDVMEGISAKITRRHPHVFGTGKCSDASEVKENWYRIKRQEKEQSGDKSLFGSIPSQLPSLIRAQRIGTRAARVGFDWENAEGVWEKLEEEIAEFKEAFRKKDKAPMEHEIGDVLFTMANLSRHLKIDAEQALRDTLSRFLLRFKKMEDMVEARGRSLEELPPPEKDVAWEEAKDSLKVKSER